MLTMYPYKDLVEIGRGGMATVYRATSPNGNLVALKVLAVHLATDPTARMRFELESSLRLDHPNIVHVIDWGVDDATPFIVMDYIIGESLDRRLTRMGKMSPEQLLPILQNTASALDFAHSKKVIHRDVKPSNILIRTNEMALLGDFGVAKSAGTTAYTATAARVGSVFYMSPEQANGAPQLTAASDIYSLGVTAYYALAGRHPFEADNEIAIARMHMDVKPKHVSEVNPAVPRGVGDVVMRALEKEPGKRPKSAGDFARAFEAAIKGGLPPKAVNPWLRSAFIAAGSVIVLGVGIVGLAVGATWVLSAQSAISTSTITPVWKVMLTASPDNFADVSADTVLPSVTATSSPTTSASATEIPTVTGSPTASATPSPTKAPISSVPKPPAKRVPPKPPRSTPPDVDPVPTKVKGTTPTATRVTSTPQPSVTPGPTGSATASSTAPATPAVSKTPVPTVAITTPAPPPSATPIPTPLPATTVPSKTATPIVTHIATAPAIATHTPVATQPLTPVPVRTATPAP